MLALAAALLLAALLALQQRLAVLVHLELVDYHLGSVDTHVHGGAVDLVASHPLDVDYPLLAVHLEYLALPSIYASHVGASIL